MLIPQQIHSFRNKSMVSFTSSSSPPPPGARSIKDLPTDIMISVLERLSIIDRVRFGSLCSSFYSIFRAQLHLSSCCSTTTSSKSSSSSLAPPWMLLPGESTSAAIAFFSISEGRIYRVAQKDWCRRRRLFLGSSDGWLVTLDQDYSQLYLLNPITGAKIHLPPLPSSKLLSLESSKALLSWNSSSSYTVVLLFAAASSTWPCTGLVCTAALQAWTPFGTTTTRGRGRSRREWYSDAAIANSYLYTMRSDGTVEAWDLAAAGGAPRRPSFTIVMPKSISTGFASFTKYLLLHLVNSKDAHAHGLLQVWRSREFAKVEFKVFKLEEWEWVEVKSLDGRVLFLNSCCASMSVDCLPEELRPNNNNSIYFDCLTTSTSNNNTGTNCCFHLGSVNSSKNRETMVFRMEDGTVERILLHGSIWDPSPIWIAPSLHGTL